MIMAIASVQAPSILQQYLGKIGLYSPRPFFFLPLKISKTPRVHTNTNKWWNKLTEEGEILCRRIPNNLYRYSSYRGETDKHYISQMIQINIIHHVDIMYPWQREKKTIPLYLCGLLPNIVRWLPIVGHLILIKYLISNPQSCQSLQI